MRTTELANPARASAGAEPEAATGTGVGRRGARARPREGFDRLLDLVRAPDRGAGLSKASPRAAAKRREDASAPEIRQEQKSAAAKEPPEERPQASEAPASPADRADDDGGEVSGELAAAQVAAPAEDGLEPDASLVLGSGAPAPTAAGPAATTAASAAEAPREPAELEDGGAELPTAGAFAGDSAEGPAAASAARSERGAARFATAAAAPGHALGGETQSSVARASVIPGRLGRSPQPGGAEREPMEAERSGPRSLLEMLLAEDGVEPAAQTREAATLTASAGGEMGAFERAASPAVRALEGLEQSMGAVANRRGEPPPESPGSSPTPEGGAAEALRLTEDREAFAERLGRILYRRAKAGGEQHLRIQLQPPRLGQLEVRMEMQGGQLRLAFDVESKAVRHLLHSGAAELQQSLQRQGLALEAIRVEVADFAAERRAAEQQDAAGGGGAGPGFGDEPPGGAESKREPALAAVPAGSGEEAEWSVLGAHGGWIDTRV